MALTKVIGAGIGTTTGNVDFNGDLDVDGTTNLDVVDIDGAVNMATTALVTGVLTTTAATVFNGGFTANDGSTITTADNTTQLTLKSTDADASAGPRFDLTRDSGSPADGDNIGRIRYLFDNDAGEQTEGIRIDGVIQDASDGTEDVTYVFDTMIGGTLRERVGYRSAETVFNEDSVDIDFRVESNGSANMVFVDAGNNKVAVGTATATATLTVEGSAVAKTDTDTSNSGSVTLDYTANQNFVLTMTGNVTLANPTTENVGQSGFITFIQDGTGSRVLSVGSQYFCAGGAVIVLSTAANSIDIVPYVVIAAGKICLGAPQLAFADAS